MIFLRSTNVSLQKRAVSLTEIAVGRSYDLLRCGSNAYRFSPRQSKEFAHMSGRLTELKRHSSFWLQFFITKMHLINGWWCFNFLIIIFSHYDVNDRSLGSDWFCKQLVVLQSQKMCYLKAPVILKFNGFYWTVSIRHSSQSLADALRIALKLLELQIKRPKFKVHPTLPREHPKKTQTSSLKI